MLYANEYLAVKLKEVTATQSREEYIALMLLNVSNIIKADPVRYRCYGAYWWVLKSILLNSDLDTGWLDNSIDQECFQNTTYGDEALDLLACWLFSEERMNQHLGLSPYSMIAENGEPKEYHLYDNSMEQIISVAS